MTAVPKARRVLLVLDHHSRSTAEKALAGSSWRSEWAVASAEAISLLEVRRFDAILTQNDLPDSTGPELLQQVLGLRRRLPVIFLTRPGGEKEVAAALDRGAAGYVVEGNSLPVLLSSVLDRAVSAERSRELERRGRDLQHRTELRALATALRHELNNPLTGILGNAEMGLATPSLPAALDHRFRNVARMAEQIRDVLSQLEAFPDHKPRLLEVVGEN